MDAQAAHPRLVASIVSRVTPMGTDEDRVGEAYDAALALDRGIQDSRRLGQRRALEDPDPSSFSYFSEECQAALDAMSSEEEDAIAEICPNAYPSYADMFGTNVTSVELVDVCYGSSEEDCGVIEDYVSAVLCPSSATVVSMQSLEGCTEDDAQMAGSLDSAFAYLGLVSTCSERPDAPTDGSSAFHTCISQGKVNMTDLILQAIQGELVETSPLPDGSDTPSESVCGDRAEFCDGAVSAMATAATAGAASLAVAAMLA